MPAQPKAVYNLKGGTTQMSARMTAFLLIFSIAFAAAVPDPADSRPRSSKSRSVKSEKAKRAERAEIRRAKAEAERAEAERAQAEAERIEAERARAEAERAKLEAERARAEAERAEAEAQRAERAARRRGGKRDTGEDSNRDPRGDRPGSRGEPYIAPQPPMQAVPGALPDVPERRPPAPKGEWPRTTVPLGPDAPPEAWPEPEIKEALAQCRLLLGGNGFEFKELPPIRKGVCGTPAPIQLKYINDVPRVEFRPLATMNCPLADALDRWMREVVQPRAKDLLHATVIRVVNLAAYDCRPRYSDPSQRMSHHAFAAAIDIAEFVTAKGEHVNVLEHWNAGDERAQFLRDIHDGGCKIFGTVLGPEANEAHRNHFHVDMAKRRHSAFCQ